MSRREPSAGFRGATIVLGVTGGIAAYKAADLTSNLVQAGADVHVVMTDGGTRFVQPLTFEALTRNRVYTSVFEGWYEDSAGHVTLARNADVVLVAPASANTIAKMAHGRVDDMLGAVLLATEAPIIVAPAMEHHMWHHPATRHNIETLGARGVHIVEPESGHLASGAFGDGRLAGLDRLLAAIRLRLGAGGPLTGRSVVVTAGGTREAIDPVRYLGNRSSGRMGVALAHAAIDAGAQVTLIAGPTLEQVPRDIDMQRVESARDMDAAVQAAASVADVLIMAAAVTDFRPEEQHDQKLKKRAGEDRLTLELVKNPDIIAGVNGASVLKIGFAAETENLLHNAAEKLEAKDLTMIVANDAVSTIGHDRVRATLLFRDGRDPLQLPELSKDEAARCVVDELPALLEGHSP
ncbi:MAG TPA: bifunctional phosphopantothenoylcysteine decarboxylase/phosphopantothenate--cysteine ligase CoaBC [Thermomicrobiales bacterium]|nr:bifunctional phosphopantothenoylcysteine decarboxylase/phosphopantothenate--cysteine ligase CoaBC [Thermomicrobiales bacterium]